MDIRKDLTRSLEREIESIQKSIDALKFVPIELISERFPEGVWSNSWSNKFTFTLPFRFELINEVKEFVNTNLPEWKNSRENRYVWDDSKEAGHFLEYETREEHWIDRKGFEIAFRTQRVGTTCVLNKIGEKSVPVFEVVCAAGAEEMKS